MGRLVARGVAIVRGSGECIVVKLGFRVRLAMGFCFGGVEGLRCLLGLVLDFRVSVSKGRRLE